MPRAPHFGDLWKAIVKIMKKYLHTMARKILTYEQQCTLITEVEAMLNSQSLTLLTNDPSDFDVYSSFFNRRFINTTC